MPSVGLILLAAGGSSRMGRPKQLLPWRGRTLLRRAADAALESPCRPVVVVLGACADEARAELAGLGVTTSMNADWVKGMGSSIRCGLRSLLIERPEIAAAIIMLCDQPHVDAAALRRLIDAHQSSAKPVCASAYSGTRGPPCLFAASHFPRLLDMPESNGAKPLLSTAGDHLLVIPFPEGAIDVDEPPDYQRLLTRG